MQKSSISLKIAKVSLKGLWRMIILTSALLKMGSTNAVPFVPTRSIIASVAMSASATATQVTTAASLRANDARVSGRRRSVHRAQQCTRPGHVTEHAMSRMMETKTQQHSMILCIATTLTTATTLQDISCVGMCALAPAPPVLAMEFLWRAKVPGIAACCPDNTVIVATRRTQLVSMPTLSTNLLHVMDIS